MVIKTKLKELKNARAKLAIKDGGGGFVTV